MLIKTNKLNNNHTYIVGELETKKFLRKPELSFLIKKEIGNLLIVGNAGSGKTVFTMGQLINLQGNAIIYDEFDELYRDYVKYTNEFKKIIKIDLDSDEILKLISEDLFQLKLNNNSKEQIKIKLNNNIKQFIRDYIILSIKEHGINWSELYNKNQKDFILFLQRKTPPYASELCENIEYVETYKTLIMEYVIFDLFAGLFKENKTNKKTLFAFSKFESKYTNMDINKFNEFLNVVNNYNGYFIIESHLYHLKRSNFDLMSFNSIIILKTNSYSPDSYEIINSLLNRFNYGIDELKTELVFDHITKIFKNNCILRQGIFIDNDEIIDIKNFTYHQNV